MTDKEELYLLEAIEKMHQKPPFYKKVYVRNADGPLSSLDVSNEEVSDEVFPHENLEFCNHLSLPEWDAIKYDLEIRNRVLYIKYKH